MHMHVWQGHLDVCVLLLSAAADLHSRNAYGCNAIQWASQTDSSDGLRVCRWLLDQGLDVSELHIGICICGLRVCRWLLGQGLDVSE